MKDVYKEVVDYFRNNGDVEISEGKGAQGLKYNNKMFAMFYKGDLTVKLIQETVEKFIEEEKGLPHDPGTGNPMKDRILIPVAEKDTWIEMCKISLSEMKDN